MHHILIAHFSFFINTSRIIRIISKFDFNARQARSTLDRIDKERESHTSSQLDFLLGILSLISLFTNFRLTKDPLMQNKKNSETFYPLYQQTRYTIVYNLCQERHKVCIFNLYENNIHAFPIQ